MSLGQTLSDKIIQKHAIVGDASDVYVQVRIDMVLGHDATIALLVDEFERRNLTIWDKTRVIFTNDHFSPPATPERAEISNKFMRFARQQQIEHLLIDKGICHQLMVEHSLCSPGSLIVGADSHTIMAGALGACATGMGSTDITYALATGTTWLRKPKTIKVILRGELPAHCSGRDVTFALLKIFEEDGARYKSIEFHDYSNPKLCQDDRFAISNMAVEMGAKFGIFVPDEVTFEYCRLRDHKDLSEVVLPDEDAQYESVLELDLTNLSPLIAKPWSPANVVPVHEVELTPITTAFLGSCSSARLRDIRDAAEVVAGQKIHPNVRFIVIPASMEVFKHALKLGYVETLTEAGALFNQSSCGPCGGIDKGVLGASDVCISTSNRNFRGRMGHWDSRTYLASAATVAKAALRGAITPDLY